jgi:hypothetical protein
MIASFVKESDKLVTRGAFQVRTIGVPVPVARPGDEFHEVLPTLIA